MQYDFEKILDSTLPHPESRFFALRFPFFVFRFSGKVQVMLDGHFVPRSV